MVNGTFCSFLSIYVYIQETAVKLSERCWTRSLTNHLCELHMWSVIYCNYHVMLFKCYVNARLCLSLAISYETIFICEIAYLTLFNILFYILSQRKIYNFQRENKNMCWEWLGWDGDWWLSSKSMEKSLQEIFNPIFGLPRKDLFFATLEHGILVDINLKRNLCNNTLHWINKSCKNQEYVNLFFFTFWSNANFYSRCDKFQIFAKQGKNRYSRVLNRWGSY